VTEAAEVVQAEWALAKTPFVGLVPYGEDDADFFFGRDEEKQIVTGNLRASRLTILYGPSGVGKTSLLRAGVVHDLREQVDENTARRLDRGPFAICAFQAWQDKPLPALAEAIRVSAVETLGGEDLDTWREGEPIIDALRGWTERVRTLLVVLDQFEDYFRYHPDEDGEGTFATEFPRIVNDANLRVNFLVSIREDAWAKLDRFEGRIPRLFANYVRVEHLSRDAAREAIDGPISEWNRRLPAGEEPYVVEPALVEAVINSAAASGLAVAQAADVAVLDVMSADAIEAPFIQLVLERLWRATVEAGSRELSLARLEELGGAQRIVENHLLEALGALTPPEKDVAADVFRFLATRSKTKVTQSATDLAEWTKRSEDEVSPVLDKLCTAESGRILRPIPPPAGEDEAMRYELFHDVLAEPVLDWRRRHEQERARRAALGRFARIGAGLLSLLFVFAALGIWALLQRTEARKATNRASSLALASIAKDEVAEHPDRALLLAVEANRTSQPSQAVSSMILAREDAQRSGVRAILRTHGNPSSIAFSPDGRTLAVAQGDKAVLWDIRTRKPIGAPLSGRIGEIAFSPDGRTLAATFSPNANSTRVQLWDAHSRRRLGKPLPFNVVAFSPNGRLLAADGGHGLVLWDIAARKQVGLFEGASSGFVSALAFSRDGSMLASGDVAVGGSGGTRVWDVASQKALTQSRGFRLNSVTDLAFSPDGRTLAIGKSVGSLEVLDLPERTLRTRRTGDAIVGAVAYSPDGSILAAAGSTFVGVVRLLDARTLRTIGVLRGHTDSIGSIAFSPNGRTIASASGDGTVRLWDPDSRNDLPQALRGHGDRVTSVAFSPDRHTLASSSLDATVRLWDLRAREPRGQVLTADNGRIWSVAFSPDGRTLAAGAYQAVQLWDVEGRKPIGQPLTGHNGRVQAVAFSPDGHLLAGGGSDGQVRFWDTITHEQRGPPLRLGGQVVSIAFSPDGDTFATATKVGVRLWETDSHKPLGGPLEPTAGSAPHFAFNPQGHMLASVSYRHQVLWDTRSRKRLGRPLPVSDTFYSAVVFSPDGRILVVANESSVELWDVGTRTLLGEPLPAAATSLAFSPDGRTLAAGDASYGSKDVLVFRGIFWPDYEDLVTQVCSLVAGNLSENEWQELVPGLPYRRTCPD
jgi:WD40 repeat protein